MASKEHRRYCSHTSFSVGSLPQRTGSALWSIRLPAALSAGNLDDVLVASTGNITENIDDTRSPF
ncbi:hypothetical protein WDW37_13505 [Bdellovibrionota bacterium FG-1]